jgi:hypothetical protein
MAVASNPAATSSQLDVILDGTWVILPSVDASGNIISIDAYSPSCGHPHGALFVNQIDPNPWPGPFSFYLLNDHSHLLNIQRGGRAPAGMPVSGIDQTINHCLAKGRPVAGNWDLMLSIAAGPDAWASSDTILPQTTDSAGSTVNCLSGKDAPTASVSGLQTLSYVGVTGVELCGAPITVQAQLPAPWSGSGSLIFEGDVPYNPTMEHERAAFTAMANMAGMDLRLDFSLPPKTPQTQAGKPMPRIHTGSDCTYSLIILPS